MQTLKAKQYVNDMTDDDQYLHNFNVTD